MTARWYVVQIERSKEKSAEDFITALEFEAYIPRIRRRRRINKRIVETNTSRFGIYIFAHFDADLDPWGHLTHSKGKRAGIVRVLASISSGGDPFPIPVPDGVIETIRAFKPPVRQKAEPFRFVPGEPVFVLIAGVRKEAVFVEYCGTRPMVRTWILGAERVTEVKTAQIETPNLDNDGSSVASSAA